MKNVTKYFILVCFCLIIVDLLLKKYVISTLNLGENIALIDGMLTMTRVESVRNAFSQNYVLLIRTSIEIIVSALFIFLFYKSQRSEIGNKFKYSSTLILFGYLGNMLDKVLLTKESGATGNVLYLWFEWSRSVVNLSQLMMYVGILYLIFSVLTNFKEFTSIIKKN